MSTKTGENVKLTAALVGFLRGSPSPWPVVVVRQTVLAVLAVSSVLAKAMHCRLLVPAHLVFLHCRVVSRNAMGGVTIALAPEIKKKLVKSEKNTFNI